jgi:hypothetical protein
LCTLSLVQLLSAGGAAVDSPALSLPPKNRLIQHQLIGSQKKAPTKVFLPELLLMRRLLLAEAATAALCATVAVSKAALAAGRAALAAGRAYLAAGGASLNAEGLLMLLTGLLLLLTRLLLLLAGLLSLLLKLQLLFA